MRPAFSITRSFTSFARRTTARQTPNCRLCPGPPRCIRPFSVTYYRANDSNATTGATPASQELVEEGKNEQIQEEDLDPEVLREIDRDADEIDREIPIEFKDNGPKRFGIFAEDEQEDELATEEDDEINDDAITSMAHTQLEEHRELREYARIIAWDMPSLSSLAKPFTLPPETHVLRFRYTTYMGESHPAEPKVVLEVCTKDLTPTYLTEEQRVTLVKLLGTRYNPEKDLVRMSCEKFPSSAQNKRYLGDLINTLITEAKKGDSFADVPVDTRHHNPKPKVFFPSSWEMTDERREQLMAAREERKHAELVQTEVVDGNKAITNAKQALFPRNGNGTAQQGDRVRVPVGGQIRNDSRRHL